MKPRRSCPALGLALAFLVAGCDGSPGRPDLLIEPIRVESVSVLVGAGVPATVEAHVRGVVGDGCSTVHSTTQRRSEDTVTVTILRERPADAVCTQIAILYDARIQLEGTFPDGAYVLRVNDVERVFAVSSRPEESVAGP